MEIVDIYNGCRYCSTKETTVNIYKDSRIKRLMKTFIQPEECGPSEFFTNKICRKCANNLIRIYNQLEEFKEKEETFQDQIKAYLSNDTNLRSKRYSTETNDESSSKRSSSKYVEYKESSPSPSPPPKRRASSSCQLKKHPSVVDIFRQCPNLIFDEKLYEYDLSPQVKLVNIGMALLNQLHASPEPSKSDGKKRKMNVEGVQVKVDHDGDKEKLKISDVIELSDDDEDKDLGGAGSRKPIQFCLKFLNDSRHIIKKDPKYITAGPTVAGPLKNSNLKQSTVKVFTPISATIAKQNGSLLAPKTSAPPARKTPMPFLSKTYQSNIKVVSPTLKRTIKIPAASVTSLSPNTTNAPTLMYFSKPSETQTTKVATTVVANANANANDSPIPMAFQSKHVPFKRALGDNFIPQLRASLKALTHNNSQPISVKLPVTNPLPPPQPPLESSPTNTTIPLSNLQNFVVLSSNNIISSGSQSIVQTQNSFPQPLKIVHPPATTAAATATSQTPKQSLPILPKIISKDKTVKYIIMANGQHTTTYIVKNNTAVPVNIDTDTFQVLNSDNTTPEPDPETPKEIPESEPRVSVHPSAPENETEKKLSSTVKDNEDVIPRLKILSPSKINSLIMK